MLNTGVEVTMLQYINQPMKLIVVGIWFSMEDFRHLRCCTVAHALKLPYKASYARPQTASSYLCSFL